MGLGMEIGVDLGTSSVLVYIRGKGIVLKEPSVVAVNSKTGKVLAVGESASLMLGRTPGIVEAIRPLREGVISDFRATEVMLKAIESGVTVDADFFKAQQEQKGPKTIKERLLKRLAGGCICTLIGVAFIVIGFVNRSTMTEIHISSEAFTVPCILGGFFFAIGIALLIVFLVGRRMLAREMEAEVKELEQK